MPDHHHPESRMTQPPTARQLRYLRDLSQRTGRTFVPPKTRSEASAAIKQLQTAPRSTRIERDLDRQVDQPAYGTAVRDDETTGFGVTARWA